MSFAIPLAPSMWGAILGDSYTYGHSSPFRCSDLGREVFIKFYFILNAGYSDFGGVACKFLRIYTDQDEVYAHLGGSGEIHLYNHNGGSWSEIWGPSIAFPGGSPIDDGQWHSFALYANLENNGASQGTIRVWLDTDESQPPTYEDSTHTWGGATRFDHICLQQNFSAQDPTRSTAVGLDDVEIWDGMPGH